MRPPREPDLELRGKLIRAASGLSGEMLPGSFVEKTQTCLRPAQAVIAATTAKSCTRNIRISILIDGKPQALNIPAELVDKGAAQKIEMRRRFDAAAATICGVNPGQAKEKSAQRKAQEKEIAKFEPAPAPVRGLSRQGVWLLGFGEALCPRDGSFPAALLEKACLTPLSWGRRCEIPSSSCRSRPNVTMGRSANASDRSAMTPLGYTLERQSPEPVFALGWEIARRLKRNGVLLRSDWSRGLVVAAVRRH